MLCSASGAASRLGHHIHRPMSRVSAYVDSALAGR
jgi:hypothetical protein